MTPTDEPPTGCCVRHWLPHPAARVYAALVDPEELAHWYGPDGLHVETGSAHVEAHVGGTWRLVLVGDHDRGIRVAVQRTIRRLEPGRLLEAEEAAPSAAGVPGDGTLTWRVELVEDPADATEPRGTTVEVREGPLPGPVAALSATGWGQSLARLATVLG